MDAKKPWEGKIEPFCIFGNLYFVGTVPASTHMVDTGDGLIIFDCGYEEALDEVLENIGKLGFCAKDIKYVITTHGHIDHCGAAKALSERYGCKLYIGERDRDYVNGTVGLTYAAEFNMKFNSFEPDVLLKDGDIITLGNTSVLAVATPGHTPGAMSFFFNVSDGKKVYRAGLHGGLGLNTLYSSYLDKYDLPYSYRDEFVTSMKRLQSKKVDIFLGNHVGNNHTLEKAERIRKGDKEAFVDPNEWVPFCERCIKNLESMLIEEKGKAK